MVPLIHDRTACHRNAAGSVTPTRPGTRPPGAQTQLRPIRNAAVLILLALVFGTSPLTAGATPAPHPRPRVVRVDPILADRTEATARWFCDLLNERTADAVDFVPVLAPSFVDRTSGLLWGDPTRPPLGGAAGLAADLAAIAEAFPDYSFALQQMTITGDDVFLLLVFQGTQTGPLAGLPPTGERVAIVEIDRLRLRGGRIVERQGIVDERGLLWQIGVVTRL